MLLSLLQVGLLTMGVGVKASTPIYLNEQPQIQQKQNNLNIQKNNANEEVYTFTNSINTQLVTSTENNSEKYENIQYCDVTRSYTNSSSDALTITTEKHTTTQQLHYTPYGASQSYWVYWPTEFYPNETYIITINPSYPTFQTTISFTLLNNIEFETTDFVPQLDTHVKIVTSPNLVLGNNYTIIDEFEYTGFNPYQYTHNITLNGSKPTYVRIITTKGVRDADNQITNWDYYPEGDLRDTLIYDEGVNYVNEWLPETTKTLGGITIAGKYTTAEIIQEVVDIPGMMWEILTMPFAFISTAFNLTLFPNTPYSINISNLVLTIFGVLVFVFIFKLLLKK